jgi:hypothetical protein
MLLVGLTACAGPGVARRTVRAGPGAFFDDIARLSDQLARGALSPHGFARRTGAKLLELELESDVLADWEREGPVDPGLAHNGTRILDKRTLRFAGRDGAVLAILFYTPPGVTNPPHEHHNLISIKRVLKGSYHVRQYERVRRVEPGVIAIRQVSELVEVGLDGPCVDMTDDHLNVHWFGAAGREPVLALNIVAIGSLAPAATFHGAGERRAPGQYYIDPTGAPDRHGVILAPSVGPERAAELARLPLAHFPPHLNPREPA